MMNKEDRLISADLLKSISIIGVVWIHSFSLNNSTICTQTVADAFRFCVPSFIILYAFFYEKGLANKNQSEYVAYISKRLFRLAIPYVFWSILYFFIFYDASSISWATIINGHFGGYGWAGQFFLVVLLQLTIVLPFLRKYVTWRSASLLLFMSLVIYLLLPYGLWQLEIIRKSGHRLFVYWVPYVFFGIAIAKKGIPDFPVFVVLMLLVSVAIIPVESNSLRESGLEFSPYIMPSVLISSVAFTLAILSFQKINKIPKLFKTIGENTFAIFLLNPLVINYLPQNFLIPYDYPLISEIGMTLLIIVVCLILSKILCWLRLGTLVGQR